MNEQSPSPQSNCPPPADHCTPPPPATEPPCPPKPKCPTPPKRPCPPPEVVDCESTPTPEDPPATPDPACKPKATTADPTLTPVQQQLTALQAALEAGQKELLRLSPLKASIDDIQARIESLEAAVAAQPAASAAYTALYNSIERYRSEIDCSIPTVRCQLELTEKTKACVRNAIEIVDNRIKKMQKARDDQKADVALRETKQKKLAADLAWATRWNDFFTTGLQAQVTQQRDDLKALNLLADPTKDQCEVWFYLNEMEAILRSTRTAQDQDGKACYAEDLNIATFLECWSPKCYADTCQYWIVEYNTADSAAKLGEAELAEATKRAADLEKLAAEAVAKRRESILKELKTQDCCGPLSKCP